MDFQATFLKMFSLKLLTKDLKLRDPIFIVGMGVSDWALRKSVKHVRSALSTLKSKRETKPDSFQRDYDD